MLTTTLNRIRAHKLYEGPYDTLLRYLGKTEADDEPLPYPAIVEAVGLEAALWCCRAEPKYDRTWRLFAVWCARQVQHLMQDQRSINALDVSERYANGQATDQELEEAWEAARSVARTFSLESAWGQRDARTVSQAVWRAAWAAEGVARRVPDNAKAVDVAAWLVGTSEWALSAARAADAAREAHKQKFLEMCEVEK